MPVDSVWPRRASQDYTSATAAARHNSCRGYNLKHITYLPCTQYAQRLAVEGTHTATWNGTESVPPPTCCAVPAALCSWRPEVSPSDPSADQTCVCGLAAASAGLHREECPTRSFHCSKSVSDLMTAHGSADDKHQKLSVAVFV